MIEQYCQQVAHNFGALAKQASEIELVAHSVVAALKQGNKVLFCGNGGSAADSQHLAAELMGRYKIDRGPLPALSLTVDTSALTAIANDYTFCDVFSRQLRGIGRRGDVLVALSTSGTSRNVLYALETARELGVTSIGLTGEDGGSMRMACDFCVCVPSRETNHIQEMHIAVGHIICSIVEKELCFTKP